MKFAEKRKRKNPEIFRNQVVQEVCVIVWKCVQKLLHVHGKRLRCHGEK